MAPSCAPVQAIRKTFGSSVGGEPFPLMGALALRLSDAPLSWLRSMALLQLRGPEARRTAAMTAARVGLSSREHSPVGGWSGRITSIPSVRIDGDGITEGRQAFGQ